MSEISCSFNESTTVLHDVIECPKQRQEAIDLALVQDAWQGKRGDDQRLIAIKAIEWAAKILRKNHDYGSSAWKRPVLAPECDPGTAIRVRMSDKIERIQSLLTQDPEIVSESLQDSMDDLGAYCLLESARPRESKPEVNLADDCPPFKFIEFNERRKQRGAEAARFDAGDDLIWMSMDDIEKNIALFGPHPELVKALKVYKK